MGWRGVVFERPAALLREAIGPDGAGRISRRKRRATRADEPLRRTGGDGGQGGLSSGAI